MPAFLYKGPVQEMQAPWSLPWSLQPDELLLSLELLQNLTSNLSLFLF
jgi:hypothetical protein